MEKRTLIAILLSLAFIVVYQYALRILYPDYGAPPPPLREAPGGSQKGETLTGKDGRVLPNGPPRPVSGPAEARPGPPVLEAARSVSDATKNLLTAQYEMKISQAYGSVVRLAFREYRDYEKRAALEFLEAKHPLYGIGGFRLIVDGNEIDPARFESRIGPSEVRTDVSSEDFRFSRKIIFGKSLYGNMIEVEMENLSSGSRGVQIELSAGSGITTRSAIDYQYMEANWISPDLVMHVKPPGTGKSRAPDIPYRAASIKSRHFSSLLEPLDSPDWIPVVRGLEDKDFSLFFVSPKIDLAAGERWAGRFFLFIGPNATDILKPYQLEGIVNFGKLDTICKLFLGGLQLARKLTRNYGVAIILLTLGMNVLLLPLTKASFMSMRRMQLVQPEMAKMREKYKKDPQRLNKEMMELYRKNKVNPMGGCLPMLIQMPVFISLYVTLSKSTELLNSKFLWINDLASPDVVPLPFSLPLFGQSIHILPLIMVAAMFIQQKLSSAQMQSADPQAQQMQRMMLYFMPVFFGFIFYPMPSGLVIYWLTNTVVMSSYQIYLKKAVVVK